MPWLETNSVWFHHGLASPVQSIAERITATYSGALGSVFLLESQIAVVLPVNILNGLIRPQCCS